MEEILRELNLLIQGVIYVLAPIVLALMVWVLIKIYRKKKNP